MKRYYLKVHPQTNVILDCIEYEYGNYIPFDTEFIPPEILGGWFKFENGEIVEYPELKPSAPLEERFDALEEQHAEYSLDLDFRLSMLELGLM